MKQKLTMMMLLGSSIGFVMFGAALSAQAATFTVTSTGDSGAGSLRQAIHDANALAGDDTINFSLSNCPCAIALTSGELSIANNGKLTISGPGANQLSVSGSSISRVFFIQANANAAISNLTVTGGNAANSIGGGIFSDGTLTLNNSTVSGNSAIEYGAGGGITIIGGTAVISNSTVTGNSALFGGGIFEEGSSTEIVNTIIAGNTAVNGFDVYGSFNSQGYNLIGSSNGSFGFGATGDKVGTEDAPLDAKLLPLADNGGPTKTHALAPDSPAIDAGNSTLTIDQRGFTRPVDALNSPNGTGNFADIGAFEVQNPAPILTSEEQCKNGGWMTFTSPRRFRNQGDCIQFVNTGR